jgi:hypothetical protein
VASGGVYNLRTYQAEKRQRVEEKERRTQAAQELEGFGDSLFEKRIFWEALEAYSKAGAKEKILERAKYLRQHFEGASFIKVKYPQKLIIAYLTAAKK